MIRVVPQPEYAGFNSEVRIPGKAFLAQCPSPSSDQFRKRSFWAKAAPELHAAYSGICAYTSIYLIEQGSVDHFLPKAAHPHLAYEWDNFRLASGRVNNSKGNSQNILDPFEVQDDWFFMDVPDCLLRPNPSLPKELRNQISGTINSLRLNQDDNYVQDRCAILIDYARGDVSQAFLRRRYPFIAKEVDRQGLTQDELRARFRI